MSFSTCPHCNAKGLVEGTMQSTGTIHFRPLGVKFMTFRTADVAVQSFMCPACGNITMKGDLEKLELVQNSGSRENRSQPVTQKQT